ncbi:hypothetical protein ABTM16_19410, partial [Acinetobacter baumannii]
VNRRRRRCRSPWWRAAPRTARACVSSSWNNSCRYRDDVACETFSKRCASRELIDMKGVIRAGAGSIVVFPDANRQLF